MQKDQNRVKRCLKGKKIISKKKDRRQLQNFSRDTKHDNDDRHCGQLTNTGI